MLKSEVIQSNKFEARFPDTLEQKTFIFHKDCDFSQKLDTRRLKKSRVHFRKGTGTYSVSPLHGWALKPRFANGESGTMWM